MNYLIIILTLILSGTINSYANEWKIDKSHSKITFLVKHMMISEVQGQFDKYEGKIIATKPDFTDIDIELTIDASSINTDNQKRDGHLRSEDFFDTEKYPTIVFKGSKMERVSKGKYILTGDFTMLGKSLKIALDVSHLGTIKDPYGNIRAGFKLTGRIDRTKWGLKYNSVIDNGGLLLSEDVDIICNIELIKQ